MGLLATIQDLTTAAKFLRRYHDEVSSILERVHRLEIERAHLMERVDTLEGLHMKLRNQFNGARGGRPRQQDEDIPHGDKAALRRKFGIVPRQLPITPTNEGE